MHLLLRHTHLQCILDLLALRQKHGLDCRAKVTVRKAAGEGMGSDLFIVSEADVLVLYTSMGCTTRKSAWLGRGMAAAAGCSAWAAPSSSDSRGATFTMIGPF
jgi:hypothetical protein